jgi:heparosan-N-sulfate-glucuronate 5-epimerase
MKFLGVPISSQWNKSGHIYPIQVAQFGLSHFSKWIEMNQQSTKNSNEISTTTEREFSINKKEKFIRIEDEKSNYLNLLGNGGFDFKFKEHVMYETTYPIEMAYFQADIQFESNSEIKFEINYSTIEDNQTQRIELIYAFCQNFKMSNTYNFLENEKVLKSYSTKEGKSRLTFVLYTTENSGNTFKLIRNVCLDICKGLLIKCDQCVNSTTNIIEIRKISLKGKGRIANARFFRKIPHFEMATLAANYLVQSQNKKTGGWPIFVSRKFDSLGIFHLNTSWYSAMAQGQAISLLCRLYFQTKNQTYFFSALNALNLYGIKVNYGGFQTEFLNTGYIWFEEYPTRPHSLFVLNGFIYSIFGIKDFINSCLDEQIPTIKDISVYKDRANKLYSKSLKSLIALINMFDTGQRTLYDLRHLSNPKLNPNVARWDYHTLHVSQLFYLINIVEKEEKSYQNGSIHSSMLKIVAHRWKSYLDSVHFKNSQLKTS